jgi:thymidylate synthase (FAD)
MIFMAGEVPYLKAPGLVLISKPDCDLSGLEEYFKDYESNYLEDTNLESGSKLVKFAGQCCYQSWSDKRTLNINVNKYINHIKESKHGSVLEHANYTIFMYGVSRAFTHELVRHRAGFAYSQLSQRYVEKVRFVEPECDQKNEILHDKFLIDIQEFDIKYKDRIGNLIINYPRGENEGYTDYIKRIRSDARSVLPNCCETQITVTANARAWHHFFLMRGEGSAWIEIRRVAYECWKLLNDVSPDLFGDFEPIGDYQLKARYVKV